MKNAKLLSEKKVIDDLFKDINGFTGDPYLKSLLTFHLCVRISGFIENCVRTICMDYSSPRAKDNVQTYISNKLKKFPNPTLSEIITLTTAYSKSWADSLKKSVNPKIRSSLKSINVNRNAIVHGGSCSITINDLMAYYNDIILLVEGLENTFV